jgi:hypothetical protein
MKKLLLILILSLSLQSSRAADIRDFQIEGISVGDSLLNHFNKEFIEGRKKYYYPNSKKFFRINTGKMSNLETYEAIQFQLLRNDKKYIIYSISGIIMYENNIEDCYDLKKTLVKEIKSLFPKSVDKKYKRKHPFDKTGKSFVEAHNFMLESGGTVQVKCSDWSEEMHSGDKLTVGIVSEQLIDFLNNEAYN